MPTTDAIRFLHLQKTGGSTFSIILRRQYFFRPTFDLGRPEDLKSLQDLSSAGRLRPALFLGHSLLRFGVRPVDQAQTITFLRHPVKRVLSLCQHVHEGKPSYFQKDFGPPDFDLDRFLAQDNVELSNFQTRILIPPDIGSYEALLAEASDDEIVSLAFDTLVNGLAGYGLTEYFDESLVLFSSTLGWRLPPLYVSRNKGSRRNPLRYTERHLERISEINRLDLMLYEKAQKHFLNIINGPVFNPQKLSRFRALNGLYRKAMHGVPSSDTLPYPLNLVSKALR